MGPLKFLSPSDLFRACGWFYSFTAFNYIGTVLLRLGGITAKILKVTPTLSQMKSFVFSRRHWANYNKPLLSLLIALSVIFLTNQLVVDKIRGMLKSTDKCFLNPEMSSSVLSCSQPKDVAKTFREEERNQKISTFKKLESEAVPQIHSSCHSRRLQKTKQKTLNVK